LTHTSALATRRVLASLALALLTVALMLSVGACTDIAAAPPHALGIWSADGTQILFVSDGDTGIPAIYSMDASGTNQLRLTGNEDGEGHPRWSPNGALIAFDHADDIWTLSADGTQATNLTNSSTGCHSASWSPDGTHLAFVAGSSLYTMDADGSNVQVLVDAMSRMVLCEQPCWSPDGTRIAFAGLDAATDSDAGEAIYTVSADREHLTRLSPVVTYAEAGASKPSWSPDSRRIAYESIETQDSSYLDTEICVMNADCSGWAQLTNNATDDSAPFWSPDGSRIAFTGLNGEASTGVFTMNADGTGVVALSQEGTSERTE
jgi:Tol biopolymer transport system component